MGRERIIGGFPGRQPPPQAVEEANKEWEAANRSISKQENQQLIFSGAYPTAYAAVQLASEQKPEPDCTDCSTSRPRYYLFSKDKSHKLLAGPEFAEKDLYISATGGKRQKGGEVLEVPPGSIVVSELPSNASGQVIEDADPGWYALKDRPALSGTDITDPKQEFDELQQPNVSFSFTDDGREAFQRVTREIAQRGQARAIGPASGEQAAELSGRFAVVLDNEVKTRPIIDFSENPDGIDGRTGAQISGGFTSITEAQDLATFLQIGALPVNLKVEELVLEAPLAVAERHGVALQVMVSAPDERGRRDVSIHSRGEEDDAEWTRHARGVLVSAIAESSRGAESGQWPPDGAEPIELVGRYDRLAEGGFEHGPAFQSVRAAWRIGDELCAEVALPDEAPLVGSGFVLHPILLDASLHALVDSALAGQGASGRDEGPVAAGWSGVQVLSPGASSLRVRLTPAEGGLALRAFDENGAPVAAIDAVGVRSVERGRLDATRRRRSLHRLEWVAGEPAAGPGPRSPGVLGEVGSAALGEVARYPDLPHLVEAIESGAETHDVVVWEVGPAGGEEDPPAVSSELAIRALGLVQEWLAEERLRDVRLALLTRGGVGVGPDDPPDLAVASLWGLLRSAQAEHPDRLALVDVDESEHTDARLLRR